MPLIQLTNVTVHGAGAAQPREALGGALVNMFGGRKSAAQEVAPSEPKIRAMLDDVTLNVRNHETLAVLGPSGSGKTTLLKVVAGLIKPDSGTIEFNNAPIADVPLMERRIGMVFQGQALYETMTGQENIGFYYRLRKRQDEIPQRVKDVSRLMDVELEPLMSRRPPTLSGGERQKVAIARALAREFDVFLFDEPLTSLDTPMRNHLRVAMKRIFNMYPVTTLYVTHDRHEAMAVANRLAIMKEGRVVQVGSTLELLDRPVDTFIASFLGNCNFLPGRIIEGEWALGQTRHAPPPARAEEGNQITLGVRPAELIPDPQGQFEIRILDAIPYHDRRVMEVRGKVENQDILAELPIDAELGETIRVRTEKVLWFDTKSGTRLRI